MARAFEFCETTKKNVFLRQQGRCACCGERLHQLQKDGRQDDFEYHHVIPNQTGNSDDSRDDSLRNQDNAVGVCRPCHVRVHADGNWRTGALAPADYFSHSHGKDSRAHREWAASIDAHWQWKHEELRGAGGKSDELLNSRHDAKSSMRKKVVEDNVRSAGHEEASNNRTR